MRPEAGLSPFTQEAAARGLAGTLVGVVVRCGRKTAGDEPVGMGRRIVVALTAHGRAALPESA